MFYKQINVCRARFRYMTLMRATTLEMSVINSRLYIFEAKLGRGNPLCIMWKVSLKNFINLLGGCASVPVFKMHDKE